MKLFALILACVSIVVTASAESPAPPGAAANAPPPKPKSIMAQQEAVRMRKDLLENVIRTLNKKNTCSGDGECEVLEMGQRHCGGPSDFIIVSSQNTQLASIKAKVAEYTSVEKELNLVDPPLTCTSAPTEPYPRCVENACVAGKR